MSVILNAEVDFHAHAVCSLGVKLGYWQKVSHVKPGPSSFRVEPNTDNSWS
jgi:hypothetical protein